MRSKYNIAIDTIKICYTSPTDHIKRLLGMECFEGDGWRITKIQTDKIKALYTVDIHWEDKEEGGLRWHHYGYLEIGDTFTDVDEANQYAWLTIANKMLYEPFTCGGTCLVFVSYIADCLGLQFNNITRLDIAIDCDRKNLIGRIIKACKRYTSIIKGTAYKPSDKADVMLLCTGQLKNLFQEKELIIKHTDGKCSLRVYDKAKEANENSKGYITAKYGDWSEVWRTEVSLNNKAIREYIATTGISYELLYRNIITNEKAALADIVQVFLPRLVYWRTEDDTTLSVFDLPR